MIVLSEIPDFDFNVLMFLTKAEKHDAAVFLETLAERGGKEL